MSVKLNNNVEIPVIGLGSWQSKPGEVQESIRVAVEIGYRHFDCAFFYGNESDIGSTFQELISRRKVKREDLFITSKLWNVFHSRHLVLPSLKESLANLRTTYLDLYLMHWPTGYKEGGDLFPLDENGLIIPSDVDYLETWAALEDCYKQGLVKGIGVSNFNSVQIDRLLKNCKVIPAVNQVESHPYLNQDKLFKFCTDKRIQLIAYAPLGSPGNIWAKQNQPNLLKDNVVLDIAKKHMKTAGQVLLRYQTQRGFVVIAKSTNPGRIKENFESQNFDLTPEDMEKLNSLNRNHRYFSMQQKKEKFLIMISRRKFGTVLNLQVPNIKDPNNPSIKKSETSIKRKEPVDITNVFNTPVTVRIRTKNEFFSENNHKVSLTKYAENDENYPEPEYFSTVKDSFDDYFDQVPRQYQFTTEDMFHITNFWNLRKNLIVEDEYDDMELKTCVYLDDLNIPLEDMSSDLEDIFNM